MSKEIVDAIHVLEQEKGIAADTLMDALEDALLSAYKKSPGSARYARVDIDHHTGDFVVNELLLPEDLEEQLLSEAEALVDPADLEPTIDPDTGELGRPRSPSWTPLCSPSTATRSKSATSPPRTSAACGAGRPSR